MMYLLLQISLRTVFGAGAVFLLAGSHSTSDATPPLIVTELAFNLTPHTSGSGNTFAIIDRYQGKITRIQEIPEKHFVLIATGNMQSKANPKQVNFFHHAGIPRCKVEYDEPFHDWNIDCLPLEDLWKLRFQKQPLTFVEGEDLGWAGKEHCPNDRQMFILEKYGIQGLDDYVIGEQAFELIRDCGDPNWVNNYK